MIYKVILNNKKEVQIDEGQYKYIVENIDKKFIKIDDYTLLNPSYIVLIEIDREATRQEIKENKMIENVKELSAPEKREGETLSVKELIQKYRPDFISANEK